MLRQGAQGSSLFPQTPPKGLQLGRTPVRRDTIQALLDLLFRYGIKILEENLLLHIAIFADPKLAVKRGTCEFEVKTYNAYTAGAIGAVVADTNDFTDATVDPDDILGMACRSYCDQPQIPIPGVFVSWASTQILDAGLEAGGVQLRFGTKDSGALLTTRSLIWEDQSGRLPTLDSNHDNDLAMETTHVGFDIFSDGFENASTSQWSTASP